MSFDTKINRVLNTFTKAATRLEAIVERAVDASREARAVGNEKLNEAVSLQKEADRANAVAKKIRDLVGG